MRESPIGLEAIRIRGEGWEVLAHGGPSIPACKAIMLKSGAILGGFDRRWRRRGSERWTLAKTLGFFCETCVFGRFTGHHFSRKIKPGGEQKPGGEKKELNTPFSLAIQYPIRSLLGVSSSI